MHIEVMAINWEMIMLRMFVIIMDDTISIKRRHHTLQSSEQNIYKLTTTNESTNRVDKITSVEGKTCHKSVNA